MVTNIDTRKIVSPSEWLIWLSDNMGTINLQDMATRTAWGLPNLLI